MKKEVKESSAASLKQIQLESALEESRFMTIIEKQGKNILFLIVGLIALFIIAYRLSLGHQVSAEADYINAQKAFSQLLESEQKQNEPLLNSSLDKLKQILISRPELNPKYDGLIAQTLLKNNNIDGAKEFANLTLNRVSKENLPFFNEYAKTTLMISSGKYEDALNQAVALKEEMQKVASSITDKMQTSYSELLYTFNLFRIAMLQQQLGAQQQELQAWNELKKHLGPNQSNQQSLNTQLFLSIFNEGKINLYDYIEYREKQISK